MIKRDKRSNITRILHALWVHKAISRVQIARMIDLDKSTVTKIVNELIDEGLINVVAEGEAGPLGGRKPVMLNINPDYGCVIGVEVQPEFCKLTSVDLSGNIIETQKSFLEDPFLEIDLIKNHIRPFAEKLKNQSKKILGLGIGLPGVVDPFNNHINKSIPLGIDTTYDIMEQFSDWPYGPVIIENDANCCAWGELAFWRQEMIKDFLTVLVEVSDPEHPSKEGHGLAVGFGVVIDGRVHYGRHYSSGEFRSLFWENGCMSQFSLSQEELRNLRDDVEAQRKFTTELSRHIALLTNMFNMSHIFFGGDASLFSKELPSVFDKELNKNWPYGDPVDCQVYFLSQGRDSVAYGAAGMILNSMFSDAPIRSYEGNPLPNGIDFLINNNTIFGG